MWLSFVFYRKHRLLDLFFIDCQKLELVPHHTPTQTHSFDRLVSASILREKLLLGHDHLLIFNYSFFKKYLHINSYHAVTGPPSWDAHLAQRVPEFVLLLRVFGPPFESEIPGLLISKQLTDALWIALFCAPAHSGVEFLFDLETYLVGFLLGRVVFWLKLAFRVASTSYCLQTSFVLSTRDAQPGTWQRALSTLAKQISWCPYSHPSSCARFRCNGSH